MTNYASSNWIHHFPFVKGTFIGLFITVNAGRVHISTVWGGSVALDVEWFAQLWNKSLSVLSFSMLHRVQTEGALGNLCVKPGQSAPYLFYLNMFKNNHQISSDMSLKDEIEKAKQKN